VEGARESDYGAVLQKGMEGCSDSGPGSDEVLVIGVCNGVDGRVRSSNGLKRALKHQCEEEGPEGVPRGQRPRRRCLNRCQRRNAR
jgi:hypothetical protein